MGLYFIAEMKLSPNLTPHSQVVEIEPGVWRLELPAGPPGRYRLAQLDDYTGLSRRALPLASPCQPDPESVRFRTGDPWHLGVWFLE